MPYVHVDIDVGEFSDRDLIDELEVRGYIVIGKTDDPLFKIRQSFILDSPEEFRKFVANYLAIKGMPV
jgi:hypothetical protein